MNQPEAAPTDRRKPRPCGHYGWRPLHQPDRSPPPFEPERGRAPIEPPRAAHVLFPRPFLTSRGVRRARAWKRSAQTRPHRPMARFTPFAMRMASPWRPRERTRTSSASTRRWTWSCWTEKC